MHLEDGRARTAKKTKPMQSLNVAKLPTTTGRAGLCNSVQRALASSSITADNSINDDCESLGSTVYTAPAEYLIYPRRVNADWFDNNDPAIETLLRDNRDALQERVSNPQS
ncbi:hypothetical protein LSAT2_030100 [Lamellibrachia satsuma]|nr:hypothetical protein LSAT2_030100 [Lamellibrachia satsuma]